MADSPSEHGVIETRKSRFIRIYGSFMVAKLTNMYNYNAVTFIGLMVIGTLVKLVGSKRLATWQDRPDLCTTAELCQYTVPRYVMICVHGNF